MLDKKMTAVLKMLSEKVGYGYKVVKKQSLLDALPKRLKINDDTFNSILTYLKQNDYVVVKYQDKEDMCLTLTVKAESYLEGEQEVAVKSKIATGQAAALFIGVFLAAFLGAFIAEVISKLLF